MSIEKKLEAIRSLTEAGYTLFPLAGHTKVPPEGLNWRSVPHGRYGEKELINCNYGISLGKDDLVLDLDPRNFKPGDSPLKRLVNSVGIPFTTFVVQTGRGVGCYHIFFKIKVPEGMKIVGNLNKAGYAGLDTKHHGGYVVGAGSVHPETGGIYQFIRGAPSEIMEAPSKLIEIVTRPAQDTNVEGTGTFIDDGQTRKRYADYLGKKAPTHGSFIVACHGRDLGLPPETTLRLMVEVWNERRSSPRSESELRDRVRHAYRYAQGPVGSSHPSLDFKEVVVSVPTPFSPPSLTAIAELVGTGEEPSPKIPDATGGDDSRSLDASSDGVDWAMSSTGTVLKNFHNLLNYLKAPGTGLTGIFGFNEFSCEVEFVSPAPWHRGRMPHSPSLTDADLKLLKAQLAIRNQFERSVTEIEEAVTVVARMKRFHPVREYLQSLKWDGVPRLDFWLRDFLGVEDTDLTRAIARKTLCAAIMRVMKPGCKFDYTLILEGSQGVGKSELCKILGGEWAADFAVDPANKDTIQYMQGRWIIELADLQTHNTAEVNALKAFLTRRSDRVRLAYGRLAIEYPRQSIFIGSFNPGADGTYLKDDTGNRRYWTVKCNPTGPRGKLDFAKFKAVRNQLWAEAYEQMRGKNSEPLYMETEDLEKAAEKTVALRHAEHPWTERVGDWIDSLRPPRNFVTARQVFVDALGGIDKQFDTRTTRGISQALKALGWKPHTQILTAGRPIRGYERINPVAIDSEEKFHDGIEDLEREHALSGSGLI